MPDELKCPNPECRWPVRPRAESKTPGSKTWHWVACGCGLESPAKRTQTEAIAAWNRITFQPKGA